MTKIEFWIITLLLVIPLVVFGILLSIGVRRLPDVGQPESDSEIWIYKDHPVFQQITLGNNNFNVITVYMRNVGLRNRKPITFVIRDADQKPIRQINLNGYNIGDGDSVRFQFDPIPDSAGTTYTIEFDSVESVFSNAVGIGYSKNSISFQTYYLPTNKLAAIVKATTDFTKSLSNVKFLIVFIGLGTIASVFSKLIFKHV